MVSVLDIMVAELQQMCAYYRTTDPSGCSSLTVRCASLMPQIECASQDRLNTRLCYDLSTKDFSSSEKPEKSGCGRP